MQNMSGFRAEAPLLQIARVIEERNPIGFLMVVPCCYCSENHYHGPFHTDSIEDFNEIIGHRLSHCSAQGSEQGYRISLQAWKAAGSYGCSSVFDCVCERCKPRGGQTKFG